MKRTQNLFLMLACFLMISSTAQAQESEPMVDTPAADTAPAAEPTPQPAAYESSYDTASTAPAAASGGTALKEGAMSLSLGVPGGGNPYAAGTAGVFYAFSPQTNIGFNIGLGIDTASQPDSTFNLLLAPVLKYYLMPGAEITPFWLGQLNFGITTVGSDAVDLSIAGGFGAEWFVTHIFSIAGYMGIGVDILRPNDTDPLRLGTFTSGITAQLYF